MTDSYRCRHKTTATYAYLMSQAAVERDNPSEGLMLHPVIDGTFDEEVTIQGRRIRFATVDLTADGWRIADDFLTAVSPRTPIRPSRPG